MSFDYFILFIGTWLMQTKNYKWICMVSILKTVVKKIINLIGLATLEDTEKWPKYEYLWQSECTSTEFWINTVSCNVVWQP